MDFLQALILGIVQGISEFLPISSTGHLILTSKLLGISSTEFLKTFEIAIQSGSILSVVVLYAQRLMRDFELVKKVAAAFIPTAIVGFVLYKVIKKFLLGNSDVVVWALLLGGVFLIIFEMFHKEDEHAIDDPAKIPYKTAIMIGLFQSLAMIPGVSRSAATIIGGLILGLKRRTIVEFSFLLAVPTMLAATGLDLLKSAPSFTLDQFYVLGVGFVSAFVVSIVAIKFLLNFIKNNNFIPFGIYRIIVAIVFIFFINNQIPK